MDFANWLKRRGLNYNAFARIVGLTRNTIRQLSLGRYPSRRTMKRLVRMTKNMPEPLTAEHFKKNPLPREKQEEN